MDLSHRSSYGAEPWARKGAEPRLRNQEHRFWLESLVRTSARVRSERLLGRFLVAQNAAEGRGVAENAPTTNVKPMLLLEKQEQSRGNAICGRITKGTWDPVLLLQVHVAGLAPRLHQTVASRRSRNRSEALSEPDEPGKG